MEGRDQAEEDQQEDDHQEDKAIPGDALFVPQWTEPLDPPCSQVADELGIGGGGATKVIFQSAEQSGEIILANTELIVVVGGIRTVALGFERVAVHLLKNRLVEAR